MAKKWITVHTDGCALGNPGPAGYGAVLRFNEHRKDLSGPLGHATGNAAELLAIIMALEAITEKGCDRFIAVYSDSQYAVGVCSGRYRVKENKRLVEKVKMLCKQHKEVTFSWIPREQNEEADQLSKKGAKANEPSKVRAFHKAHENDHLSK